MKKIKLYPIKIQSKDSLVTEWTDENGNEHFPRYCYKCGEGLYQGHILEIGNTYCSECFKELFTHNQATKMYQHDEQFYTEWDDSDFDESKYELIEIINSIKECSSCTEAFIEGYFHEATGDYYCSKTCIDAEMCLEEKKKAFENKTLYRSCSDNVIVFVLYDNQYLKYEDALFIQDNHGNLNEKIKIKTVDLSAQVFTIYAGMQIDAL